jgi:hypothetical protein
LATFTYIGKETTYLTKVFIKIAYHTNNSIQESLIPKLHISEKFSANGVYKLTCPDCGKTYIGQPDKIFSKRYTEHLHALRNNSSSSKFAHHLYDHLHIFGPIDDTMLILNYQKEGSNLSTTE